jgi:hypothetical protein
MLNPQRVGIHSGVHHRVECTDQKECNSNQGEAIRESQERKDR